MTNNNQESSTKDFILGAIFGATVSAVAALLFAPKSGKELRKDISESTTKTLENTDQYLERAREKGTEVMHTVEDTASNYFSLAENKMKSAFSKAEEELDERADEMSQALDKTADKLEEQSEITEEDSQTAQEQEEK